MCKQKCTLYLHKKKRFCQTTGQSNESSCNQNITFLERPENQKYVSMLIY